MPQLHHEPPLLASGVTASIVAEASRDAGLLFLEGVESDWGKTELAAWLAGPYRSATRHADPPRRSTPPPASEPAALREDKLHDLMREARWHVLAVLEGLALPGNHPRFIDLALADGHVLPRRDAEDGVGWVPVDLRGMRLRARVESLFAADYLTRPRDYVVELFVCHRCEAVVFDAEARRRGDCGAHETLRPVAPPGRVYTLGGLAAFPRGR